MWNLWWTKRHWGRFSPSTSVSPAKHPTDCSTLIIIIIIIIIRAQIVACVPSELNLTPTKET
jgi:hypothetical protein